MRLRWLDALVVLYGLLFIGMGIYAFTVPAHKSLPSLIAGCTSGVIEIGFAAYTTKNPRFARIGASVVALLLFLMMGKEYMKSQKVDFLILTVASLVVVACLLGGHFYAVSRRKASGSAGSAQA